MRWPIIKRTRVENVLTSNSRTFLFLLISENMGLEGGDTSIIM